MVEWFLSGKTDSPDTMEKAVLIAGNVEGVAGFNVSGIHTPAKTVKVESDVLGLSDL